MNLLQSLCSVPTAPFAEDRVIRFIDQFVADRKELKLSRDGSGNLLIEFKRRAKGPRWIFAAHMDHPGFVARRMIDKTTLEAAFFGGVMADFFPGAKVRFFDGTQEVVGTVLSTSSKGAERKSMPTGATIRIGRPVSAGSIGMWDQGTGRSVKGKFYSRVCDNLAGAAGALTMLDELRRRPAKAPVAVLLTRAEEEGFVGAIAACRKPKLLRKDDRLIIIETSAKQTYAPQGEGAIIRVGDRASIFHSALTFFITQQAESLTKSDKRFKYQRALMPGGVCEATVYDAFGYIAASICTALGNYHNMDKARGKIGPEYIDLADWRNMVKLFVQVARTGHKFDGTHSAILKRLNKRFMKLQKLL